MHDNLSFNSQALMDSNLPRLQLELYKEIKKVVGVFLAISLSLIMFLAVFT